MPGAPFVGVETLRHPAFPELLHVRLEDADGVLGTGETFGGPAAVIEAFIHDVLAPELWGRTPDQIYVDGGRGIYGQPRGPGPVSIESLAASALDLAMWDAAARRLGSPVHALLGSTLRTAVPVYVTCCDLEDMWGTTAGKGGPLDHTKSKDDPEALARDLRAEGYPVMKVWFLESVDDLEVAVTRLEAIRRVEGIEVAIDLAGVLSAEDGSAVSRALDHLGLAWIEDPVPAADPSRLGPLARELETPLCGGEFLAGAEAFERIADSSGGVSMLHLDLGWGGGVSAAAEVMGIAGKHGREVHFHQSGPIGFASSVHAAMVAPTDILVEVMRPALSITYPRIAHGVPAVAGGVAAPSGPGHGCSLLPSYLAECRSRTSTA